MSKAVFPSKPAVRPLAGSDYELAQHFYFPAAVGGGGAYNRLFDYSINRLMDCKAEGRRTTNAAIPHSSFLIPHSLTNNQQPTHWWPVIVHVSPGFRTDGASIPRFLWRVFGSPYDPDIFPAAIAHDALYRGEIVPRKDADAAFLRMMNVSGVQRRKRRLVWLGVRLFGWITWRRHTSASVAEARRFIGMSFLKK